MAEENKNKGGRPSKYEEKFCEDLIEHMSLGLSIECFGGYLYKKYKDKKLRIAKDTVYEWAKKHEEFSDAKSIGEAMSRYYWEDLGRAGASGQIRRVVSQKLDPESGKVLSQEFAPALFNAGTWIFNMKNRFNWKDKRELSGDPDKPLTLAGLVESIEDEDEEVDSKS